MLESGPKNVLVCRKNHFEILKCLWSLVDRAVEELGVSYDAGLEPMPHNLKMSLHFREGLFYSQIPTQIYQGKEARLPIFF